MSQESRLRGRTYTPGFSDALGERFLARGSGDEAVLEVLKFRADLSDSPDFEKALRARIDVVHAVGHNAIAVVHGVERPDGLGLCLVSEHVQGRRLSELGPTNLGPAFALEVIRTVTPVLCVLNQAGVGVANGALSAERMVVASDGRLVVVEHVMGWAIESLRFSRQRLNELGIVVGASEPPRFDSRTDMIQLGFLALSLLLRRRLDPADCPTHIPSLLDEAADNGSAGVRVWLERALQVGSRPFGSAHEALDALDDLDIHEDIDVMVDEENALLEFPEENPDPAPPQATLQPTPPAAPQPTPLRDAGILKAPVVKAAVVKAAVVKAAVIKTADAPVAPARKDTAPAAHTPAGSSGRGLKQAAAWILSAMSLVAIGYVIAVVFQPFGPRPATFIVTSPASDAASVAAQSPERTPSTANPANETPASARQARSASQPTGVRPGPANAGTRGATATAIGSVTLASAIELQVFLDGTLIGSTGRSIALPAGTHRLEVVNETLEFRQAQTVRVDGGRPSTVRVVLPNGKISLNATPWADVTIDGTLIGQTPLANYLLPIGTHEIVFRHPQLGVRRQTVVLKAGTTLRVTEAFQQ